MMANVLINVFKHNSYVPYLTVGGLITLPDES